MKKQIISQKENDWLHEVVEPLWKTKPKDMKSSSFVTEYSIQKLYSKTFKNISRTQVSISSWIDRVLNRKEYLEKLHDYNERKKTGQIKASASKNPLKIFLQSDYIVIVPPNYINGFETEEEVKTFLSNSQILSGVKLFVAKKVNISFDIKIG